MKFYLWWGWDPEEGKKSFDEALSCIKAILQKEKSKQLLHIPFARTGMMKKNRSSFLTHNFSPIIENLWIKYFNAMFYEEIEAFEGDTIFINWGNDCEYLLEMCQTPILLNAIKRSKIIIWESCWSMIFWEYFRNNHKDWYIQWLWFIKDTLIEPHYSQKIKEERLKSWMSKTNTKYWLWIDESTYVEYANWNYWEVIWFGKTFHF